MTLSHAFTRSRSLTPSIVRGVVAAGLVGTAALAAAPAQAAQPAADAAHVAARPAAKPTYLLTVDPTAQAVYVHRDGRLTGTLGGVKISTHGGTQALSDGRILMVDDLGKRVLAVRIDGRGRPYIEREVAIPGGDWEGMTWGAIDPAQRYLAFAEESEGATSQITVVDLRTFAAKKVDAPLAKDPSGKEAEAQVYLAGRPLQLVYTTGGQFRSMPLADVLAGKPVNPTSAAPVGVGTHGPVVSRDGRQVFSTVADGFSGATILGDKLANPRHVDYSATRDIVQNYRPRLAADGHTVWGVAAEDTKLTPENWADTRNDVNILDTSTFTSSLVRIPDGVASRFALSSKTGAVATVNPEGDTLTLVDTDPASATYRRVVGSVALPSLSKGPVAGKATTGTSSHVVTVTPDGKTVYVANAGDGTISVVDVASRRLVKTLRTPSALTGAYVTAVTPGARVTDLVLR